MKGNSRWPAARGATVIAVCAMLAASCYGPNDNSPTAPSVSYKISAAANNVSGPVGSEISSPLGVFVSNAANYEQHGVRVDFKVIDGEATLNPAIAITDTSGIAWTRVTPLYAPGEIRVEATIFATQIKLVLTANGT